MFDPSESERVVWQSGVWCETLVKFTSVSHRTPDCQATRSDGSNMSFAPTTILFSSGHDTTTGVAVAPVGVPSGIRGGARKARGLRTCCKYFFRGNQAKRERQTPGVFLMAGLI